MLYRILRPIGAGALAIMFFLAPLAAAPAKPLPSKNATVSRTVTMLEQAKKTLETETGKDTSQHRAHALADIEKAMSELRDITQSSGH